MDCRENHWHKSDNPWRFVGGCNFSYNPLGHGTLNQKSTWSVLIPVWLEPDGRTNFPIGSMDFLMSRKLRISSFNFSRIAIDGATDDWVDRDCKPKNAWQYMNNLSLPSSLTSNFSFLLLLLFQSSDWPEQNNEAKLKYNLQFTCSHTFWASCPSCWYAGAAAARAWRPPVACRPSCSCRSLPPSSRYIVSVGGIEKNWSYLSLIHAHRVLILSISNTWNWHGEIFLW